jgi:hypothetical protein
MHGQLSRHLRAFPAWPAIQEQQGRALGIRSARVDLAELAVARTSKA